MKHSIPRPQAGSSPFQGPGLSRRAFVELSLGGLVASWFLRSPSYAYAATTSGVIPRGSAKNAIFVFLPGAPSQIDTWDLKEGPWTPPEFAPATFAGDIRFPQGLMPRLADQLGDIVIVRSCLAWALVHGLAQTWSQISRNPTSALGNIAPHIGSVVALEMESKKDPKIEVLPSFISLNTGGGMVGSGYLPSIYSPFSALPTLTGLPSLSHPDGATRFALRWSDLQTLDGKLRTGEPLGKDAADMAGFYDQAKVMMDSPDVNALFAYSPEESQRYGNSAFGNSCVVAKKLLAGRRGVRFVQVSLGGWDNHSAIYNRTGGVFRNCAQLDPALAALLQDLKASPGETSGQSLLDETLVVVLGEFGRTVGNLNGQAGRDHFLRTSVLFAGGGVKGGRVIGSTDATGAKLNEAGWSGNRDIRTEDIAATIYSTLGIDWTTVRYDDPLKRGFEYVPYAKDGSYKPIDELFG